SSGTKRGSASFGRITPISPSARICPTPYMMPRPVSLLERSVPLQAGGATNRKGSFEIGGTFGGTGCWRRHSERPPGPILYSKSGADGRIRTGDPLFTKQLLCQLSYVGVRPDYMERLRGLLRIKTGGRWA